jgi:hypothetical protein
MGALCRSAGADEFALLRHVRLMPMAFKALCDSLGFLCFCGSRIWVALDHVASKLPKNCDFLRGFSALSHNLHPKASAETYDISNNFRARSEFAISSTKT